MDSPKLPTNYMFTFFWCQGKKKEKSKRFFKRKLFHILTTMDWNHDSNLQVELSRRVRWKGTCCSTSNSWTDFMWLLASTMFGLFNSEIIVLWRCYRCFLTLSCACNGNFKKSVLSNVIWYYVRFPIYFMKCDILSTTTEK